MRAGRTRASLAVWVALVLMVSAFAVVVAPPDAEADGPPAGFTDDAVLTGLELPTNVEFAPDGRIFVAEKSGIVRVFDSIDDPTASVFADLRTKTLNYGDLGMVGLELHPNWGASPWVYVTYTHDAPIGGTAPTYGQAGQTFDSCSIGNPPTCPASGRLSRMSGATNTAGPEQVLIEDWCQAGGAGHSVDEVRFGPDGALYVTGGDGARAGTMDIGATPYQNTCEDPPAPGAQYLTSPTSEGGALRAQDIRTSGDPQTLDGTLIRVNGETGAALPDNPNAASPDPNARRVVAYGLRNAFRFTFRPGTNEVWLGDVGWRNREEINRITSPTDGAVENFGWPCYEGFNREPGYDSVDVNLCESLYAENPLTRVNPYYAYTHNAQVVAGGDCAAGDQGSVGTPVFYPGGDYPARYDNALFFSDYARGCLFAMLPGAGGLPSTTNIEEFSTETAGIVDLEIAPDGDLYYVNVIEGSIHRIAFNEGTNQAPVAVAEADHTEGQPPLTVHFDGTDSSDPDGDPLTYAWDLDGDGQFDDSTSPTPQRIYQAGSYAVGLRVTDPGNLSDTDTVTINVGNTAPVPTIGAPSTGTTWRVGQTVNFAGSASDAEDGTLAAARLSWQMTLFHCPNGQACHQHPLTGATGVASGSFVAPDHEMSAYIELRLTATDSGGLSSSVTRRIDPQTATIELRSNPPGIALSLNADTAPAPLSRAVIRDSGNTISAPQIATLNGATYAFSGWSDGGAASHGVTATGDLVRTATYVPTSLPTGYWTLGANGIVSAFGGVSDLGDAPTNTAIDIARTPSAGGYWVVNRQGSVYAYGNAPFLGGAGALAPFETVTSISATPSGNGYWLFTSRGRVITKGDAGNFGDVSAVPLNGPVLDSVATPSGQGYYMVASDGGVFAFGDARFAGSMGGRRLNAPVRSLVPDGDGTGYWLVADDGGVFAFAAPFRGSMGGIPLNRPVSGMVRYGNGYLMVAEDGGVFNFSNLPFQGSLGGTTQGSPIVSIAASP